MCTLNESIFSFYISKSNIEAFEAYSKQCFDDYIIYTDRKTPLDIFSQRERLCAIFGYAIDLRENVSTNLAERILVTTTSLQGVIEAEYNLGGKYLLIYKDDTGCYMLGDATCSVPIYYTVKPNTFICTSSPNLIIEHQRIVPDHKLQHIRESSNISQAMPFDVTEFVEVKQLIPNHYLSFEKQESFRFINATEKQKKISVEEATAQVKPLIECLARFYIDKFKIYCPITSGRDSRVVLSFLSLLSESNVDCYTIKHEEHHENEQDLIIPQELCLKNKINYCQIEDVEPTCDLMEQADALLGKGRYSYRTLNIANTVKSHFGDGAIVNGDIIGQVGKCSLHRDIPTIFASAHYFRCKLHNYSQESIGILQDWMANAAKEECVNIFDLFSIENRMGRWAGQENLIYNAIGQLYLNIFNSRSIIYTWTAVRRKLRKKSLLHIALIKETKPAFLRVPFEKEENIFIKVSKANGLFYYISSCLKYHIEKNRFWKEKR